VEKDIPQGRVFIGHLGIQRESWEDPEAFSLSLMNDILGGGGFTSRLMKRIRSDEGLAYGAYSSFGVGDWWPGEFRVRYESKSATVAYAAQIAINQINGLRNEPVSEEELRTAKAQFIEVFPRRFESPQQIVGTFANDEYIGRPHGYWLTYRDQVAKVTLEDIQQAAQKRLHPDQLVMLVVGKWADIQPGDPDGKASMEEFGGGNATELPLRDPLTLKPME
jgi:predicted Zn-dependent peptidase